MLLKKIKKAFTLMELVVVLVILGIIVGMGVPGYIRTVEIESERMAIENLKAIYEAQQLYRARYEEYMTCYQYDSPPNEDECLVGQIEGLAHINDLLGVSLRDNERTGNQVADPEGTYVCQQKNTPPSTDLYEWCAVWENNHMMYYIHLSKPLSTDPADPNPCCSVTNPDGCRLVDDCICTEDKDNCPPTQEL